jgi:phosphatidylinositol dimannoside acyltransferase
MSLSADLVRFFLYYPFRYAIPLMKPESVYKFARFYHNTKMRKNPKLLERTAGNIAGAMNIDNSRSLKMAGRSLLFKTYNDFDFLLMARIKAEQINRIFTTQGLENLDNALSAGKGVIYASIHSGSTFGVFSRLSSHGYKINTLHYKYEESEYSFITRNVYRKKFEIIRRNLTGEQLWASDPWTKTTACLRRGESLGMYIDGLQSQKMVPVEMFNTKINLSSGPILLALRTGAMIVPFAARRLENGFSKTEYLEPMSVEGRKPAEVADILQEFAKRIEPYYQDDPAQWQHWDLLEKHQVNLNVKEGNFST